MGRVLIVAVLLCLAVPAAAQDPHPCDVDGTVPSTALVTPPFGVSFCSDEADVAGYEIALDGVTLPFPGAAVKSETANAAGFFAYESPVTLTAPAGVHTVVARVIDSLGRVSASSTPPLALIVAGDVDPQTIPPVGACTAPAVLAIKQCDLVELAGAGFSISCATRCADPGAPQPAPEQPVACTSTPLTVAVKLWPSTQVGKSATVFFQASQNVASAVVAWVPRLTLTVTDTRGCTVTIAK